MKREICPINLRTRRLFHALCWTSLIVIGLGGTAPGAEERKFDKPSFSPGDYWVYSTQKGQERHEYVGEEGGYHVFMIHGTRQLFDSDLNVKDAPRKNYEFPLSVGKYWSYELEVRRTVTGSTAPAKTTCEVKGMEQVETPAGTFQALNITCSEMFTRGGQAKTRRTYSYWYAPEVKQFIKNTDGKVLKEFKIKK